MRKQNKQSVLLVLPETLVKAADEAADSLQISRLAFIRQSIVRNVAFFQHNEKPGIDSLFSRWQGQGQGTNEPRGAGSADHSSAV
jgi:hypothetical protein